LISISFVVEVVEATIGGGTAVVVCSVVVVRVTGAGPHPASTVVPASNAAPIVSPKHDFVPVIICFLRVQAVAGPVHLCTSADPPDGCRTVRTVRQP
jgi:hypothetical protein